MKYFKLFCLITIGLFLFSGCQTLNVGVQGLGAPHKTKYKKKGPPPHAPAHGYRHKHHRGHNLVFDSGIGAYVVLNVPETYFGNNLYMRLSTDGKWMVSTTLEGGWRIAAGNEVPHKLKAHKEKKHKKPQKKKD